VTHKPVSRVVALEEAFTQPRVWELYPESLQQRYEPVRARLTEVGAERIRLMDVAGIDLQVLSHVQPGIQILPDDAAELALAVSREVNNWLAEVIAAHPTRLAAFAMLPTQSPADAADELQRTVRELGFRGALINGHTNGRYLDDPSYEVLLGRAESLGVPIYIHPTDPPAAVSDAYYAPFDAALVPTWGWPVETGTHLLRLICAGVFDRHPNLKIIVGHMGELLPYWSSSHCCARIRSRTAELVCGCHNPCNGTNTGPSISTTVTAPPIAGPGGEVTNATASSVNGATSGGQP
jgi:predicted TIM-barrel fold metal-dependent hydrolase